MRQLCNHWSNWNEALWLQDFHTLANFHAYMFFLHKIYNESLSSPQNHQHIMAFSIKCRVLTILVLFEVKTILYWSSITFVTSIGPKWGDWKLYISFLFRSGDPTLLYLWYIRDFTIQKVTLVRARSAYFQMA